MSVPVLAVGETPSLDAAKYFISVTQDHFCAMYGVVVWDWITSFQAEYRLVWKSRWTAVKISYLFCRYWVLAVGCFLLYCFVGNHTFEVCQKIYRVPVILAMWNQIASEVILLIRTYAFFNRNLYVLLFLISALVGVAAYQLYVALSQMLLLPFLVAPFTSGPCYPESKYGAKDILGFFLAPLGYDTIVTGMTVGKALMMKRRGGGATSSHILRTFVREGVFYYIFISAANLINGIFYLQPNVSMSAICIPLSVLLSPVIACRMILDLRQRGTEGSPELFASPHYSSNPLNKIQPQVSRECSVDAARSLGMTSRKVQGLAVTLDGVEMGQYESEESDYKGHNVCGIKVDVETVRT